MIALCELCQGHQQLLGSQISALRAHGRAHGAKIGSAVGAYIPVLKRFSLANDGVSGFTA